MRGGELKRNSRKGMLNFDRLALELFWGKPNGQFLTTGGGATRI